MLEVYKLTKLGRKIAGGVNPTGREKILDFLYETKVAGVEEIANSIGEDKYAVKASLRRFEGKGIVQELTTKEGL